MSDQPTTEHLEIDAELAEGIAKRRPTTDEWTADDVDNMLNGVIINLVYLTKIADIINSALAAEREKLKHELILGAKAMLKVQQLREQLATAVEALKVIEIGHGVDARTARAALAKIGGK